MLRALLLLLLMSPLTAKPDSFTYEVDVTAVSVEHAWRGDKGERDYAQFEDVVYGFGVASWHKSGFGGRVGYLKGTTLYTEGRYDYLQINMKHIISFELMYRYYVTEDLKAIVGVGTHLIPVPQYYEGIDPQSHMANDTDNDEGWLVGLQYEINKDFSIGWRFNHYSRIKTSQYDEWIKGHSLNLTYRF